MAVSYTHLKEYFNVPVIISKIDAGRLEDEELINERPYVKIPDKAVKADILICEDDIINLDELSFSFLSMPDVYKRQPQGRTRGVVLPDPAGVPSRRGDGGGGQPHRL